LKWLRALLHGKVKEPLWSVPPASHRCPCMPQAARQAAERQAAEAAAELERAQRGAAHAAAAAATELDAAAQRATSDAQKAQAHHPPQSL